MASAELSRRVEKVVAYPPLSEMGADQRRDFHEALLEADGIEDLPGKWQAAGVPRRDDSRTGWPPWSGSSKSGALSPAWISSAPAPVHLPLLAVLLQLHLDLEPLKVLRGALTELLGRSEVDPLVIVGSLELELHLILPISSLS